MTNSLNEELNFHEDDFRRKPIAEKLIELLQSDIDISPIIIDGEWGTGKTYFCKKTKSLIENNHQENFLCTYIDAFSADHANEPLITIIAAISKLIKKKANKSKYLRAAKAIASYGIKATGKAGIAWILRTQSQDMDKEIEEVIQSASNNSIDYAIDNLIQQHEAIEENITTLKNVLAEIALTKNLIIFIDELDRCRPDFAVSILEVIKHVFDVEGIKFVLVTNLNQMKASINHCYGQAVNAHHYLDKFIKHSFKLPLDIKDELNQQIHVSCKHAEILIQNNKTLEKNLYGIQSLSFIKELIIQNELSLRQVETFIRYLSIYTVLTYKEIAPSVKPFMSFKFSVYTLLSVFIVFVFCFESDLKEKIIKQKIKALDLCKILGVTQHQKIAELSNISNSKSLAALITIIFNDNSIENYQHDDEKDSKEWKNYLQVNVDDSNHYKENFFIRWSECFDNLI
ncbi:TPA: hypothetical protein I8Z88_002757 [Legionella pneumophila]|uniref:KAP family P-loop NTPase fold protein n=1 Tax=Legionella pneumophila TaxID=446 RepID=UPI001A223675|nr:P-loop NTPase fold protein [Legionella pneumophila]BCZ96738.1 hypothetical protein LEG80045_09940 [Legionella pneumophila]HAT2010505.1 hypothetical protein [Legionella pneumophila]